MRPLAKSEVLEYLAKARSWIKKAEAELQAADPNEPRIRGFIHAAESEAFTARDTMKKYATPSCPPRNNVDITIGGIDYE